MALRMRLRRMGAKNNPFYRVVVADARSPRDGRFVDEVGYYNPTTDPATIKINEEKAIEWLRKGAQPTDMVRVLLKRTGVLEKWQQQRAGA